MSEGQISRLAGTATLDAGDSLWQACVEQLAQDLADSIGRTGAMVRAFASVYVVATSL